jgi:hypothetical protein
VSKATYRVVRLDSGWAYQADGSYSEQFTTRQAARNAARLAAAQHALTHEKAHQASQKKEGQWYDDSG